MNLVTARSFYRALVMIHPRAFRERFGDEMLRVFEEAAAEFSVPWLLLDMSRSVVRQHLLREPSESEAAAKWRGAGLRSGIYPLVPPFEFLPTKLLLGMMLSVLLFQLFRPWT